MKRHLQRAEQQESPSNLTKYCACHARWISWMIRVTYETSFGMRGASKVTLQTRQVLRLPRKTNRMTASHMQRQLQCAEQVKPPFKLTKYCSCHEILSSRFQREILELKTFDDIPRTPEHYPSMKSSSRTRRFGDLTPPILKTHFVWKRAKFRAPAISQNCTKVCACHEKSPSNFTKCCTWHEKSILLFPTLFSLGIYSLLASILS